LAYLRNLTDRQEGRSLDIFLLVCGGIEQVRHTHAELAAVELDRIELGQHWHERNHRAPNQALVGLVKVSEPKHVLAHLAVAIVHEFASIAEKLADRQQ